MIKYFISLSFLLFLFSCQSNDVKRFANYDESKSGPYTLPDPLVCEDGSKVTNDSLWWNKRRPELLHLFETNIYGKTPSKKTDTLIFKLHKIHDNALKGKAIMKEVDIFFTKQQDTNNMRLLIYIPKIKSQKVPCFLSLNFKGNMAINSDTAISLNNRWIRSDDNKGIVNNRSTDGIRGIDSSRWPIDMIIEKGYAIATAYYGDLDPDYDDGFHNGVQPLFYKTGQNKPDSDEWGAIGAWAWGLSRALDYLITDSLIDGGKIIVLGHSRLGKTALWAGAQDQRFAIVISNCSGCCGAALSKRNFGENAIIINTFFPHWFCNNFKKYNQNESALPVDQHELIALIAPRPVYVVSASEDLWADPKGEFLGALYADTVYKFLKTAGLPVKTMPELNAPVMGKIGYHIRTGKHDITKYDWTQYLKFADLNLK